VEGALVNTAIEGKAVLFKDWRNERGAQRIQKDVRRHQRSGRWLAGAVIDWTAFMRYNSLRVEALSADFLCFDAFGFGQKRAMVLA
jgi:hypothetical protein